MDTFPLPRDEAERLAALKSYDILDTPREKIFDQIVTLVAAVLRTPIASMTLIDTDRQWSKAMLGMRKRELPRDQSFCAWAILSDQVMIVEDARQDLRFSSNPLVDADPGIRFYAGAPLITQGGLRMGTLCAADRTPRRLAAQEAETLQTLARVIVDQLDLRKLGRRLNAELEEGRCKEAELRMSRGRLADFVATASDWLWEFDAHERITFIAGGDGHGIVDGTLLAGRRIWDLRKDDTDALRARAVLAEYLKARRPFRNLVFSLTSRAGETRWIEASGTPVVENGAYAGYRGTARDVSARHRQEQMRVEIISTMFHELRTPLMSVHGALSLVHGKSMGAVPPGAHQLIDIAYRNTDRLNRFVNDVLDLEKMDAGLLNLEMKKVDLAKLARQAVELYRSYAASISFEVAQDGDEAVFIEADETRLMQVLANLLSNAAKYSPAGGRVVVTISAGEGRALVGVRDFGAGVSEAIRSRLFQRFAADDTAATRKGGTGLGLSIARSIVEAHGGTIGCDSPLPEGGSRFWITVPQQMPRAGA